MAEWFSDDDTAANAATTDVVNCCSSSHTPAVRRYVYIGQPSLGINSMLISYLNGCLNRLNVQNIIPI